MILQPMTEEEKAKMLRKQQKVAARRQREDQLKRLRTAQEIQRHLEEVEARQKDIEMKGVAIERKLREEGGKMCSLAIEPFSTLLNQFCRQASL